MTSGLLAARLAIILPGRVLELALCTLMIVASVRMFTEPAEIARPGHSIRWWQGLSVGSGVGLAAGMSGLAGGVVLVPALGLLLRIPSGWLAGTSSATIIFSSAAAALGYLTAPVPVDLGAGEHDVGIGHGPVAGAARLGGRLGGGKTIGLFCQARFFLYLVAFLFLPAVFSNGKFYPAVSEWSTVYLYPSFAAHLHGDPATKTLIKNKQLPASVSL